MTTTMTRQQLVGQLITLCCISFLIGVGIIMSVHYRLRGDVLFWFQLAFLVIASGALVFVFRRLLKTFQPSPGT